MSRIITVSREFGSGGRELGKRLAEKLGFAYLDKEIIVAVSEKSGLAEEYVEQISEKKISYYYPLTYANSFAYFPPEIQTQTDVLSIQARIIKELAEKADCVIVGRSADVILEEMNPFKLFVYADLDSRIQRCIERDPDKTTADAAVIRKQILRIDRDRFAFREMMSASKWGDKANYHLCVNTTGRVIEDLIDPLAEYAKGFFKE